MSAGRLALVVPYRNRPDHLREFVPHMVQFLKDYDLAIVVIEQADNRLFNRGALLNIGFLLARDSEWFAFHDIDMLPLDSSCDYSKPAGVCHLAGCSEQFGFRLPYENYCGGVLLVTPTAFEAINGFSNEYWGWGSEDDDVFVRFWRANFPVERRPGRYRSLPHGWNTRSRDARLMNERRLRDVLSRSAISASGSVELAAFRRAPHPAYVPTPQAQLLSQTDGFTSTHYNVVKRQPLGAYAHFDCEIREVHHHVAVELLDE